MLPSINKLPRQQFDAVFTKTASVFSKHLTLRYSRDGIENNSRFSVVVSKKVVKEAIERNKIKRQIYGILQKYTKIIQKPYIGIFLVKKACNLLSLPELKEEILFLLKKSGIKVD